MRWLGVGADWAPEGDEAIKLRGGGGGDISDDDEGEMGDYAFCELL